MAIGGGASGVIGVLVLGGFIIWNWAHKTKKLRGMDPKINLTTIRSGQSKRPGLLVALALGFVLALAGVAFLYWFWCRDRKSQEDGDALSNVESVAESNVFDSQAAEQERRRAKYKPKTKDQDKAKKKVPKLAKEQKMVVSEVTSGNISWANQSGGTGLSSTTPGTSLNATTTTTPSVASTQKPVVLKKEKKK